MYFLILHSTSEYEERRKRNNFFQTYLTLKIRKPYGKCVLKMNIRFKKA